MPKDNFWAKNVPRAELDHRSREARRRFERFERLFVVRVAGRHFSLRRLLGADAPRRNSSSVSDESTSCTAEQRDDMGDVELMVHSRFPLRSGAAARRGKAVPRSGQGGAFGVSVPSATTFERLLPGAKAICCCPSQSEARFSPQNHRYLANVG